jgi:hypothetical protein
VILDCCNSGSGTRKGTTDDIAVRGMTITESPPSDIDQDLLTAEPGTRASSTAAGFARKGLNSHVLLAACTQKEQAREQSGRGNFTKAILQTIEAIGADKLTYASLLERMDKIPAYVYYIIPHSLNIDIVFPCLAKTHNVKASIKNVLYSTPKPPLHTASASPLV